MSAEFTEKLNTTAKIINDCITDLLSPITRTGEIDRPSQLIDAMRHGTLNGGKRIRPFLFLNSLNLFEFVGGDPIKVACAIELIHCYSLIHDDLPAMDNDDFRRGQPTVHKKFDDATAILAGDALLSLAFEILADEKVHNNQQTQLDLIVGLARASGLGGMAGGQMLDLTTEFSSKSEPEITNLNRMKTGALICFACEAGAIFGQASEKDRLSLREYGMKIGEAFQLADDLLDQTGAASELGKATGKDLKHGKINLVSLHGVNWARNELVKLEIEANALLEKFDDKADILHATTTFICNRSK